MLHSICHKQSDRLWMRLRTKRLTQEMDQRVYSIWLDAYWRAVCDALYCEMYKLLVLLSHDKQVTLATLACMSECYSSFVDNAQAQMWRTSAAKANKLCCVRWLERCLFSFVAFTVCILFCRWLEIKVNWTSGLSRWCCEKERQPTRTVAVCANWCKCRKQRLLEMICEWLIFALSHNLMIFFRTV